MKEIIEKNQKIKFFFEHPEKYLHKSFGIKMRRLALNKLLGEIREKKILDIGCGDGSVSMQLLNYNNITFVDFSEEMLRLLRKRVIEENYSNYTIIHSSAYDFETRHKFDYILCIGLLAHLENIEIIMEKLRDMISQDGKIIIQFTDHDKFFAKLYYMDKNKNYLINKTTSRDMINIIKEVELQIIDKIEYGILLRGMGKLPDSFLYWLQRMIMKKSFLKKFFTEQIWVLSKI